MHTKEPRKDPLIELGYEKEDLNMKGVGKGTLFFFVFTFVCIGLGYWVFAVMNPDAMKGHQEDQPAFMGKVPPEPLLQSNQTTKTDIVDLRANEDNALKIPAYVDQGKGVIRIPIDRAIDLTVQRLQNPVTNQGNTPPLQFNGVQPTTPATTVPHTAPHFNNVMPPSQTPVLSSTPTPKPSPTPGGTHTP